MKDSVVLKKGSNTITQNSNSVYLIYLERIYFRGALNFAISEIFRKYIFCEYQFQRINRLRYRLRPKLFANCSKLFINRG